jgi:MFS family permease
LSRTTTGIFALARGLLVPGNIRALAVTSMVTGTYISLLNTVLQPFVVGALGFNVAILGILVSVGARPSGLASSIGQPFGGYFADLIGRKPLIVLGSAIGICSMVSFLVSAVTRSLPPLSIAYLLFGLSLLGYPASQATIAESVAVDPGKVKVAFSVVFFFTQLPGAVVPFVAGYLATSVGYPVLFGAAALLESGNLVILISKVSETRQPPAAGATKNEVSFSLRQAFRVPPGLLRIFVPFGMDAFSFGLGGSIVYGMWIKQFGLTAGDVGLVVGVLSSSVVVSQYAATRFLLRVGIRKTLAFSEFITVVVLAAWLGAPNLPLLLVVSAVFGFSVATWVPAVSSLLIAVAPVEERGGVNGKLAAFRGLMAFPAPIIGGFLFNAFGYYVPISLSLVGEVLTTVALLKLIPSGK